MGFNFSASYRPYHASIWFCGNRSVARRGSTHPIWFCIPVLLARTFLLFFRPDSQIWIWARNWPSQMLRTQKHRQFRRLGEPNPMDDVPDQDSAKIRGKSLNFISGGYLPLFQPYSPMDPFYSRSQRVESEFLGFRSLFLPPGAQTSNKKSKVSPCSSEFCKAPYKVLNKTRKTLYSPRICSCKGS